MKLSRIKLGLGVAVLALAPVIAFAAAGTGIGGTDHDFSATGGGNKTTGVGACTFCHTPHKAQNTLLLWNHTLSANNFSWEVAKTTAGTTFPSIAGGTYKGPTAKCLSCHDGSVAIGDVAWFKEDGSAADTPSGVPLNATKLGSGGDTSHVVGAGGAMKGNHPVAMPYPYNNASNSYNTTATGAGIVLAEWQATPEALTSAKIRLFNDDGSGAISAGPVAGKTGIECSSCHDPHNKASVDDYFLRGMVSGGSQADGYLCLQCHKK